MTERRTSPDHGPTRREPGEEDLRRLLAGLTAVRDGDLSVLLTGDGEGVLGEIAGVYNDMVDRLSSFAEEVTRVAREVGTEGTLGGQATVHGVSGTWKDLTDNVNSMADNLTRQVRAIAEVTSAVAEGDLTRSITAEAPGEVGELRDNINSMVGSLRATIRANEDQDWLQTNLARITTLLQGTRSLPAIARLIMTEVPPLVAAQYGAFFLAEDGEDGTGLVMTAAYGSPDSPDAAPRRFRLGQSLVGQAARDRRPLLVDRVPAGYATIASGTGSGEPVALIILPIVVEEQVIGALEFASLQPFAGVRRDFLDRLVDSAGAVLGSLLAHLRTDELLAQYRRLADELRSRSAELQSRQRELQRSNAELKEKAALLAQRNKDIESKNLVIEQGRRELEVRAQQLSRTSMYKSEFLANMSHELRTPLNSLLILARLLARNPDGNLTGKQVEYAEVIHSAGSDLLQLINDILDLSKVEAGKRDIRREPFPLRRLADYLEATFGPVADERRLAFTVTLADDLPEVLDGDEARIRQILRNLLSNALKFTDEGRVTLAMEPAAPDETPPALLDGRPVLAFRVTDTGIGIPGERLGHVFEAFQQGDGTTARRYGGTGLGLSISREVAGLLGGAIEAASSPGRGSTFTFYLPTARPEPGPADPEGDDGTTGTSGAAGVPAPSSAGTSGSSPDGGTVLVVDDDPRNVFALTEILEGHGLRVLAADGGRAGLDALAAHREIGLVLMDVMMAGTDGYSAIRAIRRMPGRERLPVIAVTAKAMPGDRDEALRAGADDYVSKPVDGNELITRIGSWLAL
ncbi:MULTISPECIES: ATP-binding protein [unclassified Streptomyces]|uniref:ATP-binding protein n=1 Tax=unclassified Streptomyces TaxID=2593676 RepID=UPI00166047EC|nr:MULTISPECIES: ATP-binding protein [unclassified Streptomyces]MBD0708275.1 hybrid sensor histidine kinase/response regulator [Streptomyces sp. CBMA291]MBD0716514.1 hybrid sensor histidine kinase/response regulator [Streptomyces sp. CBMA370]